MKTSIFSICVIIHLTSFGQTRISENVYFKSGKETIHGILVRPNLKNKTPVVVFQQGSGNHSFNGYENEAWGPHKFYIEDVLLPQGFAVLYCNKRGLGESTGNWRKNSLQGRADDAYAAVQYLKTLPFIDSTRIGISGHSQGGWISQIVAAQHKDISFIICLAGPTVGIEAQTSMNDSLYFICQGYEGQKLEKKLAKSRKKRRMGYRIGKTFGFIGGARFWYLIANYENDKTLTSITCPTLLLFAEYDMNVPPDQNITHFKEVFKGNAPSNFTIKVMPKGQHGFYQVENMCVDWDTAMKQPFDKEFQNEIREWVKDL